ncbi:hypothetical protein ILYODFUR_033181 [Ilyodon furcidens]|uniref:EGF-like domain-containing protein n=1 Tax=Ilyodon furcidens TaxID=33524 RepID=A0ABV0TP64_9TELE
MEITVCVPNPCQNSGVCKPIGNAFLCSCRRGFRGLIDLLQLLRWIAQSVPRPTERHSISWAVPWTSSQWDVQEASDTDA